MVLASIVDALTAPVVAGVPLYGPCGSDVKCGRVGGAIGEANRVASEAV